jgi:hypothetical protein
VRNGTSGVCSGLASPCRTRRCGRGAPLAQTSSEGRDGTGRAARFGERPRARTDAAWQQAAGSTPPSTWRAASAAAAPPETRPGLGDGGGVSRDVGQPTQRVCRRRGKEEGLESVPGSGRCHTRQPQERKRASLHCAKAFGQWWQSGEARGTPKPVWAATWIQTPSAVLEGASKVTRVEARTSPPLLSRRASGGAGGVEEPRRRPTRTHLEGHPAHRHCRRERAKAKEVTRRRQTIRDLGGAMVGVGTSNRRCIRAMPASASRP